MERKEEKGEEEEQQKRKNSPRCLDISQRQHPEARLNGIFLERQISADAIFISFDLSESSAKIDGDGDDGEEV